MEDTSKNSQAPRRLLLLASKMGYQTRSFAQAAARLGVAVMIGSDRCHQLDDPWSDGAVALHFEQPEEAAAALVTAELAAEELAAAALPVDAGAAPVQGILALGDRQTMTGALAARALGLRFNSPESVENCRSKLRQRTVAKASGLPVPRFFSFALSENPDEVVRRVQFPCVVKPLRLSASQGVIRANDGAEFVRAVERIARLLGSPELQVTREPELDQLLVEEYIAGGEVALEGLLEQGKLRVLALFDKPDPLVGPYFEESIYVTPSRLAAEVQARICECGAQMARALGLTEGPVHMEFRVNDGMPWILEASPRPIGGLCARSLRFGTEGMPLEELLVRHAVGLPGTDAPRESRASGVMMIPVPRSGVLEAVDGVAEAATMKHIDEIEITARVHDTVAAWPEGSSYLGFIFARAETAEQVETALRAAHRALRIRIAPRLAVSDPVAGYRAV